MLDDDERVARIAQLHEDFEQLVDVREMQAGGRLVEDVNGAACRLLCEFACELDALRLAAAERRGALAEVQVAEAHVVEREQLVGHAGDVAEKSNGLVHGHVEYVGDVLALVGDLQRLAVVSAAAADLAFDIHVGEKVHLDFFHSVALARLAAPAFHIEGKPAALIAAHARRGQPGKEIADAAECAGVSHGIAARRAADGRLIDHDRLVHMFKPEDRAMASGLVLRAVEMPEERAAQDVVHERALAAAAHASHAGHAAEGEMRGDVLQVVFARAEDAEPSGRGGVVIGDW